MQELAQQRKTVGRDLLKIACGGTFLAHTRAAVLSFLMGSRECARQNSNADTFTRLVDILSRNFSDFVKKNANIQIGAFLAHFLAYSGAKIRKPSGQSGGAGGGKTMGYRGASSTTGGFAPGPPEADLAGKMARQSLITEVLSHRSLLLSLHHYHGRG